MQIYLDGKVEKFIQSLNPQTIAKTLRTIDLLERFGNQLGMPHSKGVSAGLFELRVRGQQEVRIFYCFHRHTANLLHGFVKKSNKTPLKERTTAKKLQQGLTRI